MHSRRILLVTVLGCAVFPTRPLGAQQLHATELASGLLEPVAVVAAPGVADKYFVVERAGTIRIVENGSVRPTPFLDVRADVSTAGDGGLLSLAFHPDHATNGRFFVGLADSAQDAAVREYRVSANDPDQADASSLKHVFGPYLHGIEHYGLDLHFGPDGMLYTGIGAHAYDEPQRLDTYSGKLLRLDLDRPFPHVPSDNPFAGSGDGALDLIWAIGLRHPWRFAFDPANGDLYVGEVGEWQREEIDYRPASTGLPGGGGYQGGVNYGWPCMEGTLSTGTTGCDPTGGGVAPADPVFELGTDAFSITGGRVYRGTSMPHLRGRYFFADFGRHRYWSVRMSHGQATDLIEHTDELHPAIGAGIEYPVAFGEDGAGELLVVAHYPGKIFRIDPLCSAPESYCFGAPNSAGAGARIGWSGSTSVASADFALEVTDCPPHALGVFFHGPWETQVPFGNGYGCIAGSLVRLPPVAVDGQGGAIQAFDAQSAGIKPVETRLFQFHYRDPAGGGELFNLSDALRVEFCP